MESVAHEAWIEDALTFLIAAGIIVPFFHRLRISEVLGFLVAGMAMGPYGLGRFLGDVPLLGVLVIDDPERIKPFAEFGVVFLLFVLGLELSLRRLWELRRYVFGLGSVQVVAAALVAGLAVYVLGAPFNAAIAAGLGLSLSSTAIVMQLLAEQRRLAIGPGRVSLSVLLMQDLAVVPILFVVGLLGIGSTQETGEAALAFGWTVLQAAFAIGVIVAIGRFVLRPLVRQAARSGSRELIMAITMLAVVGFAVGTEAAGLSLALGAFLAGAMLAETEFQHQIEVDIDPFKGLLLGLFFMTVGMGIDLGYVFGTLGWILAATAALILAKAPFSSPPRAFSESGGRRPWKSPCCSPAPASSASSSSAWPRAAGFSTTASHSSSPSSSASR